MNSPPMATTAMASVEKKQIVVGLLTAADGEPLAVRVFEGNTADPSTLATQLSLLKKQFQVREVVMIGDRGMIKAKGKAALSEEGLKYITALTNAQVRTLLKESVLYQVAIHGVKKI